MRFQYYDNLRIFNLAAQQGSFSAAANELNMTKGAVSYQIKGLEAELGFALFHRHPNGISLTAKGKELLATVHAAFEDVERKIANLSASNMRALTIGVTTYFASRCLSPLLMKFLVAYPDIQLRIQTMIDLDNLHGQGIDLAIRWGAGDWTDMSIDPLIACPAFPTGNRAAYDRVKKLGLEEALSSFTLLRDREDSNAWSQWHEAAGLNFTPSAMELLIIPDPNVRVQAVIDGQGIALNDTLIQNEIDNQRLFRLSESALENYGYFLAYQPGAFSNPDVEAFALWLKSELT
jgi:DNA-binding transcriptional LysR family regulator